MPTESIPSDRTATSDDDEFESERPTLVEDVEFPFGRSPAPAARTRALLTVLTGPERGGVFSVPAGAECTIGRSEDADICIPDLGLSRIHARLVLRQESYFLTDDGSTNGTFVDEVRVDAPVKLSPGGRFRLGQRTMIGITLHDQLEIDAALAMRQAALRDRLTGVYNRGVFDDRLEAEVAFCRRHGSPLSVLLFDIDHFKKFNDVYGHQTGDAVLVAVGEQVTQTVRAEDVVARYGGEEFVVIARDTPTDKALLLGERIRKAILRGTVVAGGATLTVTASIGIATLRREEYNAEGLVAAADKALYAAKRAGRNRVCHADDFE